MWTQEARTKAFWVKILRVDLSNHKIWVERMEEDSYRKYVGGVLMATKLVYDIMPKKVVGNLLNELLEV